MKDIQSIKEFNVQRAKNGYTVKVEYEQVPEKGSVFTMRKWDTLIANDVTEVTKFIEEYFDRVV